MKQLASKSVILLCVFAIGLLVFIGQSFLAYNVYNDADSSFFLYGGKILTEGGILYRDFWDQKPPAIFIQNALFIKLFGQDFTVYAILHGLVYLFALWRILSSLKINYSYLQISLLALFITYGFNLYHYVDFGNRTEFGLAIFEMLAVSFFLNYFNHKKYYFLFSAAVMSAVAFLYKPVGMASVLAFLAFQAFSISSNPKKTIQETLILLIGFLLPLTIISAWFIHNNSIYEAFNATFLIPLASSLKTISLENSLLISFYKLAPLWGLSIPILLLPILLVKLIKNRKRLTSEELTTIFLILWTFASISGIIIQRHARPHYHHPAVVPLVLTSFWLFVNHIKSQSKPKKKIYWTIYILLIVIFSRFPLQQQWNQYQNLKKESQYTLELKKLTSFLSLNLKKHESFYYWSFGYAPYLLTNKNSPGIYSPIFMFTHPSLAKKVEEDLHLVFENENIIYLIETPLNRLFGKSKFHPIPKDNYVSQIHETYIKHKNTLFHPLQLNLTHFKIFKRSTHKPHHSK